MDVEYWSYPTDTTPLSTTPDGTSSVDISTDIDKDGKRRKTSLGTIPNASLTAGETVTLKIPRQSTGTYAGTFQMFYIAMSQI